MVKNPNKKLSVKKKKRKDIKLIVKANELVEARYMFNAWEDRVFQALISSIREDDTEDTVYRIWYKDIKDTFKLKYKDSYKSLRSATISLADKSVVIGWTDGGYERERKYRIFRFVDYLVDGQKGEGLTYQEYVDVAIDRDMIPYLLTIRKNIATRRAEGIKCLPFTSYDMRNTIYLSPYARRVFELLKQYQKIGFREIAIEDWKKMFLIENEYPRFPNFYQRIVLPSIRAINKHTDIWIDEDKITRRKKGRSVYSLIIPIKGKTREEIAILRGDTIEVKEKVKKIKKEDNKLFVELYPQFKAWGVSQDNFRKWLSTYPEENIRKACKVVLDKIEDGKNITSPAGLFKVLVEQPIPVFDAAAEKKKQKVIKKKQKQAIADLKNSLEEKEREIRREKEVEESALSMKILKELEGTPELNELLEITKKRPRVNYDDSISLADNLEKRWFKFAMRATLREKMPLRFETIQVKYDSRLAKVKKQLNAL